MRIPQIPIADRVFQPGIETLSGEAQYPAGHRDRHPNSGVLRGKITDLRVHHCGLISRERYPTARRMTLCFLLQQLVAPA